MNKEEKKGYLLLFSSLAGRCSGVAVFKMSGLPIVQCLIGRSLLSLPFLCWVTAKKGDSYWPKRQHLLPIISVALPVCLGIICVFFAFDSTSQVGAVVILVKIASITGLALGPKLIGDVWNKHAWKAFAVASAGLIFAFGEIAYSWKTFIFAISAGIMFSLWDVATRWANKKGVSAEQSVLWQTQFTLVLVVVLFLGRIEESFAWNWTSILALIWIAAVQQILGRIFYFLAHEKVGNVQRVILFNFFEPVILAGIDMILNGTSYSLYFWLGFGLMLVAARLIVSEKKHDKQ